MVAHRRQRNTGIAFGLAVLATAVACSATAEDCAAILASAEGAEAVRGRAAASSDLLQLRDIGPIGEGRGPGPIGISPDGAFMAFQLRQAVPETNSYRLALVAMSTDGQVAPRILHCGGDLVRRSVNYWGIADYPTGTPALIEPKWSPDGRLIAFLARDGLGDQVWIASALESGAMRATSSAADVVDFAWRSDSNTIIYRTRPDLPLARHAIEEESLRGFRYDERFQPRSGSRPHPLEPFDLQTYAVDLTSGEETRASADDEEALLSSFVTGSNDGRLVIGRERGGNRAWVARSTQSDNSTPSLHVSLVNGAAHQCSVAECTQIVDLWWSPDASRLIYLRREGWASSRLGLYVFDPQDRTAKRFLSTSEVLTFCQQLEEDLLCLHEGSAQPRRIVRIDTRTGEMSVLLEPNPEFQHLATGDIVRLEWRNDVGQEIFGDLVLPTSYRPGARYPLIVVSYRTRGFLRGATGDEYPIHALAGRGFAVLSFSRPETDQTAGLDDRRSVQSALDAGIDIVLEMGVADPDRIGIAGLSEGSSIARFALINHNRYRAAALGSCCIEPVSIMTLGGPLMARAFQGFGYPSIVDRAEDFWAPYSLARNAQHITTPILMQLSDDEYLSALEAYESLRANGRPVEMYVFEGEHHIKWQPAHRMAIYERNIAWFEFWLNSTEIDGADQPNTLEAWRRLHDVLREPPTQQD